MADSLVAPLRIVNPGGTYKRLPTYSPDMKPLGIVGPTRAETSALVDRLAAALAERGRVGTIRHLADAPETDDDDVAGLRDSASHAETVYGLADDGKWIASGEENSLDDALAALAPDHEYVLVEGFADASIPKVTLGDRAYAGEAILSATDAAAVDIDRVLDRLDAVEPFETLSSLVASVKHSPDADRSGAIATFTGRVRARDDPDDAPTQHLTFEKYDGVADERMARIREELAAREGVQDVRLHHRTGVIEYGEDIVFVVVLAGHREEAFETVRDGINRLKAEVPLFKKEVTVEEEFWVHDRP